MTIVKLTTDNHESEIESARRVLTREIEGLTALKNWVGEEFVNAVELINKTQGRVIVSGMGKSGHIAKKIAATFASTGTPAMFVHPGEASHGDLGMVEKNDTVILLSNSGETNELKDIINYCKRFSIRLIGIVRKKTSVLVDAADVALVLPDTPEVYDKVKAPTTSTTMMLALGDALAIALLERRGFGPEDFGVFHPGGKLGSAFTKVENVMHIGDEIPLVKETEKMSSVLLTMTEKRFGCSGVVNEKKQLVGIITDGDLRRHMSDDITHKTANDIMTKNPMTINAGQLASEALSIMEHKSITNLFVTDEKKPIGIVHVHDILRQGIA